MLAAGITTGTASATFTASADLGGTMFVGDSITHGVNSRSWRWEIHKLFVDNGITYSEMGILRGNFSNGDNSTLNLNQPYGNSTWQNVHAARSSERAYEIAGIENKSGRIGNTSIRQWLNLDPSGDFHISPSGATPSTYFLLAGTNDTLSDYGNNTTHTGISTNPDSIQEAQAKLIGVKREDGTWDDATSSMGRIVQSMRDASGEQAAIVVLTIPTWVAAGRTDNNFNPEDLAAIRGYNEQLKDWGAKKGVTVVEINEGIVDVAHPTHPWNGVASMFNGTDKLHPSAQGDLIIAGNVAKALGYAGRTAGQERKSAINFTYSVSSIEINHGGTSTHTWDTTPDAGYTVAFTLNGGIGNGETGGWNTAGNFSVSIGNGASSGTLNINEAYIQWGDTILYSTDTSKGLDSLRVAYVNGNTSKGLATGFYVWLGDQLIGEGLSSSGTEDGLTITNGTGNTVTLADLSMDATGSWAPEANGETYGNPLISSALLSEYGDFAGRKDWCDEDKLAAQSVGVSANVRAALGINGDIEGGIVDSGSLEFVYINQGAYIGDIYVTLTGEAHSEKFWGFHTGTGMFKGNGYVRVQGLTSPQTYLNFFGAVNSGGIDGDLYLELSSANLTLGEGSYTVSNKKVFASIAGVFASAGGISGTFRIVVNDGTINSHIIGGSVSGNSHVGGVEIFLNGGVLGGNVAAGGIFGSVGNRSITITGDKLVLTSTTLITAGTASDSAFSGHDPQASVSGTAIVTLAGITQNSSFAQWEGVLSGGEECEGRSLIFSGTALPELKAQIENFDSITLTNSAEVGLKSFGGATSVVVNGGSKLTVQESLEVDTLDNMGTVVVSSDKTLTIHGVAGDDMQALTGGTYTVEGGATLALGSAVDGSYTVELDNASAMELESGARGYYQVTMASDSSLTVGNAANAGFAVTMEKNSRMTVEDSVTGDVTVSMVEGSSLSLGAGVEGTYHVTLNGGGTLSGMENTGVTGSIVVSDAVSAGKSTFDLSGALTDGKMELTLSALSAGSRILNLGMTGDITLVGENGISLGSAMRKSTGALLDTQAALTLGADAVLKVNTRSILNDLNALEAEGSLSYYLTGGDLSKLAAKDAGAVVFDATFLALGMTVEYTEDGAIRFVKPADEPTIPDPGEDEPIVPDPGEDEPLVSGGIYNSAESNNGSSWNIADGENIYDSVGGYNAVVVNSKTTINVSGEDVPETWTEDGLTIHNLMGDAEGNLTVVGDATRNTVVTLMNTLGSDTIAELEEELGVHVEKELTFVGDITIRNAELRVKHVDPDAQNTGDADSTTTVEGNLRLQGSGGLTLTSGVLRLKGASNDLGSGDVRFAGHDGQLVVENGATLTVSGTLTKLAGKELGDAGREHVLLKAGGILELSHSATVGEGITLGDEAAELAGTLSVTKGVAYASSDSRLAHVVLYVQDNTMLMINAPAPSAAGRAAAPPAGSNNTWELAGLTGGGDILGEKDMNLTVAGGDHCFSGNLAHYTGAMIFHASRHTQTFAGVTGGKDWNVINTQGGNVTFDLASNGGSNSLTMGSLLLERGSRTTILLDMANPSLSSGLHVQNLFIEDGATVALGHYNGTITLGGETGDSVTLATITIAGDDGDLEHKMNSIDWDWTLIANNIRNAGDLRLEYIDKTLYLTTELAEQTPYANYADNKNSLAGAQMLWALNNSAQIGGDLAAVDAAVYDLLQGAGKNNAGSRAKANEIMAAAAGAGIPAIGLALSDDLERQLRAIRNRTTSLTCGDEHGHTLDVWLNAESNYHKQDADGMLSGYKTNGWGGTVGMSSSLGSSGALGLSLTAMYNNLESESADRLKGDMDTYYVTGFAQVMQGAWRHTFIATVGQAKLEVNRTVNYGAGSYTTKGSTDGTAFGFMYEVGYSFTLDESQNSILQPIFNVSVLHANVDAYTETGSNAALCVGEQKLSSVTFGVGARYQTALGNSMWNRSGVFEARALFKARTGDNAAEAPVAFRECDAHQARTESAESGALGLELGAGISVPLNQQSSIFADLSAELRSNYTNANATVGYQVQF